MTTEEKLEQSKLLLLKYLDLHAESDMHPEDECWDLADEIQNFLDEIKN